MHAKDYLKKIAQVMRPNPELHWGLLLCIAGIAFCGTVAWNVWAFEMVVRGEGMTTESARSAPPEEDSQARLAALRALLEKRAVEEAKYVDGTYSYADPSQ